jgi:O-antigen/teichoic acid export membrane protein
MDNLKTKTVAGILWSATERLGQQAIQFIIIIIIARILSPGDFGLIGMLALFIAIATTFLDSGFGNALIQDQKTGQTDYSTVFYFNILVGVIVYLILFFSAPLIASFYQRPELVLITRLVSLNLIINAFGLIQNTLLVKYVDFKKIAIVSLLSGVLSGAVGIAMAFNGYGVWSLVGQSVSGQFLRTCLLWFLSPWRPTLEFSKHSFSRLFSFGSKLLAAGLLNQVFENIYMLIIGKFYSGSQLGYYMQSKRMQELPVLSLTSIIQNVTFPVLSSIQDDDERLKMSYRKIIKVIIFLSFPLMLVLLIVARPLIILLLTEKWLPSVPYFQILCLVGLTYPLSAINLNILNVKGRSDIFLNLEIVKKAVVALAIALTFRYGVTALIVGQLCFSLVALGLNQYYSGRLIHYSMKEQVGDILPYLLVALFMAGSGYFVKFLLPHSNFFLLVTQVFICVVVYYLTSRIFKLEALSEATSIIKNQISVFIKPPK